MTEAVIVGWLDGGELGFTLGEKVGLNVGEPVGVGVVSVGGLVGESVVGLGEGPTEGDSEGSVVGALVGLGVGSTVVGRDVGDFVGGSVGLDVAGGRLPSSPSCALTSIAPKAPAVPPTIPSIKQAGSSLPQIKPTSLDADNGSITPGKGKSQVLSNSISPSSVNNEDSVLRLHHSCVQ